MIGGETFYIPMIKFQSLVGLCPCPVIITIVSQVRQEGRRELEKGNFFSPLLDKAIVKSFFWDYWLSYSKCSGHISKWLVFFSFLQEAHRYFSCFLLWELGDVSGGHNSWKCWDQLIKISHSHTNVYSASKNLPKLSLKPMY